ncbi:MAG: polyphosphate kinase 1 [Ginsengibacter sp.]
MNTPKIIIRDISWLSFNERVLQEAEDKTVPINERIRFFGIASSNLDEFFRVRVATLKRMAVIDSKGNFHLENDPRKILDEINQIVSRQQSEFHKAWLDILECLKEQHIFLVNEKELNPEQQKFVFQYFNDTVRSNIVPLMVESIGVFPTLNDQSIYLACKLSDSEGKIPHRYSLISIPTRLSRFLVLPATSSGEYIILLEDVIRYCLPLVFSYFDYDTFSAHTIKVTRDAEIDIDIEMDDSVILQLRKGLKNRKKGKPVRFTFEKEIDNGLLNYLIKKLELTNRDNILAGGRIHNFKDFTEFPEAVFNLNEDRKKPFIHPLLQEAKSVTDQILQRDILLNFPYHSFDSVIDILREAAIVPDVLSIKITCYRLASDSKIINALINAVRNGKEVTVVLELRARFDEEANMEWKTILEDAGVKVFMGTHNIKVHAKICSITKKIKNQTIHYGFVSTGNLNENTSAVYGDHCLLTSNRLIMDDINKVFAYLENPKNQHILRQCKSILVSPMSMRKQLTGLINKEIKNAKAKKQSSIILKMNSLSDQKLILKLYTAAKSGVKIKMIIRGICCMLTQNNKYRKKVKAISIVDEYLEHARIMVFNSDEKDTMYISSADWMVRNIDHRIEVACPVFDNEIKQELMDILNIQLRDNVKARILNNKQSNEYVPSNNDPAIRSQLETYHYLLNKKYKTIETGSN